MIGVSGLVGYLVAYRLDVSADDCIEAVAQLAVARCIHGAPKKFADWLAAVIKILDGIIETNRLMPANTMACIGLANAINPLMSRRSCGFVDG